MDCSMPGFPVHHQLPELAQTHVHWVSDAIQPSHPLLSPSPPIFNLSQHQDLFQWVSSLHQVAKVLGGFSFSSSPPKEYSELISFRMDWLDLLAVQGTLKSLLQHHSSKASILQHSAFFIVQLSHPYRSTEKTIAMTRQTFVSIVMSLLFKVTVLPGERIRPVWRQATRARDCASFTLEKAFCDWTRSQFAPSPQWYIWFIFTCNLHETLLLILGGQGAKYDISDKPLAKDN